MTASAPHPDLSDLPPQHLWKFSTSFQHHCLHPYPDLCISLLLHSHCGLRGLSIVSTILLIPFCTKPEWHNT